MQNFEFPLLLDGATGTNLLLSGFKFGQCLEKFILEHSEEFIALQGSFVEAGSEVLLAPTFSANRVKLKKYGLGSQVSEINNKLVSLSKKASGGRALVAGNMSSAGVFTRPFGETSFEELLEIYSEQAAALFEAGVDLFYCETLLSLAEGRACVLAARDFKLPVFITFTISEDLKLLSGGTLYSALNSVWRLGAHAFGVNCSFGPEILLQAVKELYPLSPLPIIAKPNAGLPGKDGSYDYPPELFGDFAEQFIAAGASAFGGCCGTTPEHIASAAKIKTKKAPPVSKSLKNLISTERDIFDQENIKISPPVKPDEFEALAEEDYDVISVKIATADESADIAESANLLNKPVFIFEADDESLEAALLNICGVAGVSSGLNRAIAEKYGAVLI